MPHPPLSIIVPVLNEAEALSSLFATLAAQKEIAFELVLCDGGSTDGTLERAEEMSGSSPFEARVFKAERGRARQLNAGAAAARGDLFLFLHADSQFRDPLALAKGISALDDRIAARGDDRVAGRFALRFDRESDEPSLAYAYYETKARLDRPGCTHGDQGFMLVRSFFERVGPFDGSLPVLEDTLLAEKVRRQGEWLLLPADILTSARRFETEGLRKRQTLNALIMNFAAIGWDDFFRAAPGIYRKQAEAERLDLCPFLTGICALLRPLPLRERFRLWSATGGYVRSNAWQLALWREVSRGFRRDPDARQVDLQRLARLECRVDWLTNHPPGRLAAALLTWFWFRGSLLACRYGRSPDAA